MRKTALVIIAATLIVSSAFAQAELNLNLKNVTKALLSNSNKSPIAPSQAKTLMEYGGQDIAAHNNGLDGRVLVA